MSFVKSIRNIRILPTAVAIKRLQDAGVLFISKGKILRARGRFTAGWNNGKKILTIANSGLRLSNLAIDLDAVDLEELGSRLPKKSILTNTCWLIEKIKMDGGSRQLNRILDEAGITPGEIEGEIGEELRKDLEGIAKITVSLGKEEASRFVQDAAARFLELANLSEKGDGEFADFIINILIKGNIHNHKGSVVHFGAVTLLSSVIAIETGVYKNARRYQWLKTAALLHDVGKMALTREQLTTPRPSDEVFGLIKEHLPITVYLLSGIRWLRNVVPIIQHHHDMIGGYPAWLSNGYDKLPNRVKTCIQILQIADAFDGMTSNREYKKGTGEYKQMRGGKISTKKVFSYAEAIAELRREGRDKVILDALGKILKNSEAYLYNLKKYFNINELKLVWFGVEHLIKKGIVPYNGGKEGISKWDRVLLGQRALLWLMSGRILKFGDAVTFINGIKREILAKISSEGLEKKYEKIEQSVPMYLGPFIIILYRALKINAASGVNIFRKLIELAGQYADHPAEFLSFINSFKLAEADYSDNFFRWISLKLCGKDAGEIPIYGSRSFIANLQ
ncbi:MAG: HD domain-containing protein [Candidatus Margulisiibacteriota bacterium]|nr:HD domain-containing protein [Candidatus Margulisiibacteriota bacterium]